MKYYNLCRHCSKKMYNDSYFRSCDRCKILITKSIVRPDELIVESYYDSNLDLFLSESPLGSLLYKPNFTDLKTLEHSYFNSVPFKFVGFKELNFHRNRLRSLAKTIILK